MKEKKQEKTEKKKEDKKGKFEKKPVIEEEKIIRILSTDIPGNKNIYTGLTRIKGISWSLANAICVKLGIDKTKKIASLNEAELKRISEFIKNPDLFKFLLNRRKDRDTGRDLHFTGSDLSLKNEFDIKRLKKIRSYKGIRHSAGQPVRGQRTRSHFRRNKVVGVSKKAKKSKKG